MGYGNIVSAEACESAPRPSTLTERLHCEKTRIEERLTEINGILDRLEANPDTAEILDAVAKLGHLY